MNVADIRAMTPQERARFRERIREEIARREAALRRRVTADLEAKRRVLAARRLLDWVLWTQRGYQAGWFHKVLCARLERFEAQVRAGESPRLLLAAPPRHGKSELVSKKFPTWTMARNPGWEVVVGSYALNLALKNSRAARSTARSRRAQEVFDSLKPRYRDRGEPAEVDQDKFWEIGNRSTYQAVGVGSGLTGDGAHIFIGDDLIKDAAEARSETRREAVWDWFLSVARTRIAPGGGIIVMATRWDQDDPTGRILASDLARKDGRRWEYLNFPAIATEDEEHRRAGEALHPERWTLEYLEELKDDLGPYWFGALFQGSPVPDGGNKIQTDWIHRYDGDPFAIAAEADEVWLTSDAAKKKKSSSDLHAIHVWARKGRRYTLLDRTAGRMDYPDYQDAMNAMRSKWRAYLDGCLIEDTANGATYLQMYQHEGGLHAFHPSSDTPGSDKGKPARFAYVERAASAGQIWIPAADHYLPGLGASAYEFLTYLCAFPMEPDDDADAASQLIMRWELQAKEGQNTTTVDDVYDDVFGF